MNGGFPNEKKAIPNEYKEAVSLVCSMIRLYHQQNTCIEEVAGKFHLDPKEIEKYVKLRQEQGRKRKIEGKKYRYYIICRISEDTGTHRKICYEKPKIVKSLSKESLIEKYKEEDAMKTGRNTYGQRFSSLYYTDFLGEDEGYEHKAECEAAYENFRDYLKIKEYIYNY